MINLKTATLEDFEAKDFERVKFLYTLKREADLQYKASLLCCTKTFRSPRTYLRIFVGLDILIILGSVMIFTSELSSTSLDDDFTYNYLAFVFYLLPALVQIIASISWFSGIPEFDGPMDGEVKGYQMLRGFWAVFCPIITIVAICFVKLGNEAETTNFGILISLLVGPTAIMFLVPLLYWKIETESAKAIVKFHSDNPQEMMTTPQLTEFATNPTETYPADNQVPTGRKPKKTTTKAGGVIQPLSADVSLLRSAPGTQKNSPRNNAPVDGRQIAPPMFATDDNIEEGKKKGDGAKKEGKAAIFPASKTKTAPKIR